MKVGFLRMQLQKRQIGNLFFNCCIPILLGLLLFAKTTFLPNIYEKLAFLLVSILLSAYHLLAPKNKTLKRFALLVNIVMLITIALFVLLHSQNLMYIFSSIGSFKDFILGSGSIGMLVYIAVQFLQVMFLPIPSLIITLAGVAIYGPFLGALLCCVGVLLGSYISFLVGKVFGKKVAIWLFGEEKANKCADILNKKGKIFLIIAFLLPLFPDDLLCLTAGITTMKFKTFFFITTCTRPIGIVFMSFFGGGYIIPFNGWGLYVWPFILAFVIFVLVYYTKKQQQIENYFLLKMQAFKRK